jgi:hypothetical protein
MNNFDRADFIFFLIKFFGKMAGTVTKICMAIYRKLEKSRVFEHHRRFTSFRYFRNLFVIHVYNLL